MTFTQDYADNARLAEAVVTETLEAWKNGLDAFFGPLQAGPSIGAFPRFDVAKAVELEFQFIKQLVDVNYAYARRLAEATNTVNGAVRNHIEGLNTAVYAQVQDVAEATQSAVDTLEGSVREAASEVERVWLEGVQKFEDAARAQYGR